MSNVRRSAERTWAAELEPRHAYQSCATCHLRDRCPDPRKSRSFACTLWVDDGDDPSSRDFLAFMRNLVQRESVVPDRYAIDDGGVPYAANSYEWNTGAEFLNFQPSPYPKQLEPSLKLFGDMCVSGDTRVTTDRGIIAIKNLVPGDYTRRRDIRVLGSDNRMHRVSHGGVTGTRQLVRIISAGNVALRATRDHRVLVLDSDLRLRWRFVRDLRKGDFLVGTNASANCGNAELRRDFVHTYQQGGTKDIRFEQLPYVSNELARLVGYLMADGHYGKYGLQFCKNDPALIEDFCHCVRVLFNYEATPRPHKKKKSIGVRVNSVIIGSYLRHIGLRSRSGPHKTVPSWILRSSLDVQRNFVRAVVDCDGSFTGNGVRLSMTAHHVVQCVADALRNLGVAYTIREKDVLANRDNGNCVVHRLRARSDEYAPRVGSLATTKSRLLSDIRLRRRTPKYSGYAGDGQSVPAGWSPHGKYVCAHLRSPVLRTHVKRLLGHDPRVSVMRLDSLDTNYLTDEAAERVDRLRERNYSYHEIVRIEDDGVEDVYDLTVPEGESFVANGLVVHNCSYCRGPWYDDIPFDCDVRDIPKKVMLRRFGVCPRCGKTRLDGLRDGRENNYESMILLLGQRSGKSTGMTLPISYLAHQLFRLKNPSAFYGIKLGTVLTYTIVGINYGGAKGNVFDPLMESIDNSPWFQNMHALLDDAAQKNGEEELYRQKDTFLFYKTIGLMIAPSSPSRRSLRGKTRIGYSQDEICHFAENEKLVNISGLEVWRALSRSLSTVRPAIVRLRNSGRVHVPPALGVGISSTYSISDPGMILYNAGNKMVPRTMYTNLLPTWEANPDITFESLASEFALNPQSAWRDYGCRPPHSANPFISSIMSFKPSVRPDMFPYATQSTRIVNLPNGAGAVVAVQLHWNKRDPNTPRILALDAGRMKNAFACAVAHVDERGRLVYDLFVEIQPTVDAMVSFEMAREHVLEPIIDEMGVVVACGDRWQSYSTSDWMTEKKKVMFVNHTLKYGDHVAWRDALVQGSIDIPRPEIRPKEILHATGPEISWLRDKPTAQLLRQGIIVVDVPGKTVDKPTEGNNDVYWAAVEAHAVAFSHDKAKGAEKTVRELLMPTAASPKVVGAVGVAVTATGGGTSIDNPSRNPARRGRAMGVTSSLPSLIR